MVRKPLVQDTSEIQTDIIIIIIIIVKLFHGFYPSAFHLDRKWFPSLRFEAAVFFFKCVLWQLRLSSLMCGEIPSQFLMQIIMGLLFLILSYK
jgi:hypothetical protein